MTTWISRHQKAKPFWILMKQEMMRWQWHQLDHMQIICTLLQTDNHPSTLPLVFTDWMPFLPPNRVKAVKDYHQMEVELSVEYATKQI